MAAAVPVPVPVPVPDPTSAASDASVGSDAAGCKPQQYAFQAEINQLLSLIINAFYQEKEVFLRELVSNASDALDKMRIEALTAHADNGRAGGPAEQLCIRIVPSPANKQLSVEDNGIGMSADDLVKYLGTIAHSGTKAFMEALASGQHKPDATNLIGQFGVGFYSAFLVSDLVDVYSRRQGAEDTFRWSSSASGTFTVGRVTAPAQQLACHGTRIVLHLKPGCEEFTEEHRIRQVVKRHSDFCAYPILLTVTRSKEFEEEAGAHTDADDDGRVEEQQEQEAPGAKGVTKVTRSVTEEEELNKVKPVWQRRPDEVTEAEHEAFYKSMSGDWEPPVAFKHFEVDGQLQFKAVIYAPKRPPFDTYQPAKKKNGIRLHVRRVFVTDSHEDLVPDWLSFVRGVVDSDDMPLNVSRETLQQSRVVKVISKSLVKRSLDMMAELAASDGKKTAWLDFYEGYSKSLKMGVHADHQNRERLLGLLRFHTTKTLPSDRETMVSLKTYCDRMKQGQKDIYFLTGESLAAAAASPLHEKLRQLGVEVVLMTDPIDEYVMQAVHEFDSRRFVNIAKDGLDIPALEQAMRGEDADDADEPEEARKRLAAASEALCAALKGALAERVTKVQVSSRLHDSPCVLVTETYGWTANMERIIKAQALGETSASTMSAMTSRKILEVNPNSPIVHSLAARVANGEQADKSFQDAVQLLFDTALVSSGFVTDNPARYASRVFRLIALGLGAAGEDAGEGHGEGQGEDGSLGQGEDRGLDQGQGEGQGEGVSAMEEVD